MPKRSAGEFWECSACGEKLVGAKTVNGKIAPIQVRTTEYGNCFLFKAGSEVHVAVMPPEILAWAKTQGMELRMNHFATCPHRERFLPKSGDQGEKPSEAGSRVDG